MTFWETATIVKNGVTYYLKDQKARDLLREVYSPSNPPPYPVTSVAGKVGAVTLVKGDVGLGNVDNVKQYSASNPPPYPVTSVAEKTGAVTLAKGDVGLGNVDNVKQYSSSNPPPYPVTSVNGKTGAASLTASDVGAVDKTGDTMSGELEDTSYFTRKLSSAPVADTTTYYATRIKDQNNTYRGGLAFFRSSTYGDGIRVAHAKTVNGTTISNVVTLYIGDSGTPYVVVGYPSAWRTALGAQAGNTLSFGTDSYVRWAGDWRNATNLWFTIPLNMSCTGLTAAVSGSVIVISNNTRTTVSLSSVTPTCYVSHTGVTVNLAYSSAPSYAVASGLANVQPYGLTITFS